MGTRVLYLGLGYTSSSVQYVGLASALPRLVLFSTLDTSYLGLSDWREGSIYSIDEAEAEPRPSLYWSMPRPRLVEVEAWTQPSTSTSTSSILVAVSVSVWPRPRPWP